MTPTALHHFERIYVLNLKERTDRRQAIEEELQAIGLPVDGHKVRIFEAMRPSDPAGFPSIGARGCFLSHLNALKQARVDGVRSVLILEDDVMFSRQAVLSARLLPELADGHWDLAYPGHIEPAQQGVLRWITTTQPLQCAHCYGVHERALPIVIDYLESCLRRSVGHPDGGPMHFDGALSTLRQRMPQLTTILASRPLAVQRSSRSDIAGPSWLDKLPIGEMSTALRSIRNWLRRRAVY